MFWLLGEQQKKIVFLKSLKKSALNNIFKELQTLIKIKYIYLYIFPSFKLGAQFLY